MNKIKLLYDVTRVMKNLEKIEGVLQVKVHKDDEEVFSLRNAFEKNEAGKTRTTVSSVLNLDGGQVTRESTTEFDLSGRCHHGPGMLRRMFHGHHGEDRCCGIKGMFSRLSLAFGILSSLEVEEKGDGAAVVSLHLSEAPGELRAALLEKLQHKHDCLARHDFLKECHQVETLNGALVMTVNKDRVIETITVNLGSMARDENKGPHTLAASAEVQFA
jgi:hypothetical protein